MADIDITLFYNTHRLTALEDMLKKQGMDMEQALLPALNDLYERLVPADQREEIESRIAEEAAQVEMEREAARRFAVIHLHKADDDYFFQSELWTHFYSIASRYCKMEKDDTSHLQANEIAQRYFSIHVPMSVYSFCEFCDHMPEDQRVTALMQFNFEDGYVNAYERGDTGWRTYLLKDVFDSFERTSAKKELNLDACQEIFHILLEGKEVNFGHGSEAPDEESGAPAMQM